MRHQKKRHHLSRPADQRRALLRSLATEVLRRGSITTTLAKAKAVRGVLDRLITLGRQGDLHARRRVLAYIYDKKVVRSLFSTIAARYPDRRSGYTRVVKVGFRLGDAAPMAVIQLMEASAAEQKAEKAAKATKAARPPRTTKATRTARPPKAAKVAAS